LRKTVRFTDGAGAYSGYGTWAKSSAWTKEGGTDPGSIKSLKTQQGDDPPTPYLKDESFESDILGRQSEQPHRMSLVPDKY